MVRVLLFITGGSMRNLVLTVFLFAASCFPQATSDYQSLTGKAQVSFNMNKASESFVMIHTSIHVAKSICDSDGNECVSHDGPTVSSSGSGTTIKIKNRKYVLTAAHVCSPSTFDASFNIIKLLGMIEESVSGIGFYGNEAKFEIAAIDVQNDLCILEPKSYWVSPHAKVAKSSPNQGSEVFAVAAPFGIFEPGMVLGFEGYVSGVDSDGDIVTTIPTRPGSSGSAILDKRGNVCGVTHSAIAQFESLGIGTPVEKVHDLIEAMHLSE
jgi:S1-C subfamily serine protease